MFQSANCVHQATHLVGLDLFLTACGDRHHRRHAAGDVQLHGSHTADEMVVEQEVASDACVDSLQGVSPSMCLRPYSSVVQTRTEDAKEIFWVVDFDAYCSCMAFGERMPGASTRCRVV